jgi:hypothetical protein
LPEQCLTVSVRYGSPVPLYGKFSERYLPFMVSSGRTHINISGTRNLIALEAGSSLCKHELSESRSKAAGLQVITKWRRADETPYSGRPLKKMNVTKRTRTRRSE